ncbi:MAG TPA: SDR family oxidoreductase [Candidatus Nanopelagicales bacterium]
MSTPPAPADEPGAEPVPERTVAPGPPRASATPALADLPHPGPAAPGKRCLVTGATGYVGGRLVPELLRAGYRVRVLARSPDKLRDLPWHDEVEIVQGDAGDHAALAVAMADVDVAYYLVHAIGAGQHFAEVEEQVATAFATAAREAGVGRIVYLGGLTPQGGELSAHLRSRAAVGRILLESGVPTAALGAAVVIGSGSLSFEMLRYLTERLPVMVTPRWVRTRIQPIAIRDVLRYLVGCAELPPEVSRSFDIGGPDVLTYEQMMQRFAAVAGLKRRTILPVSTLQPELSARWIGLVTPVPSAIARPLVASLRNEVVCHEDDLRRFIPDPPGGLLGYDESVRLALQRVRDADVATRWSDASPPGAPSDPLPSDPDWAGGSLYTDDRSTVVPAAPAALWSVVESIGGENGWYSLPWAWELRGVLDRLIGGPGLRRGRRDPMHLHVGEACDFWRVEEVVPGRLLRLRAEMKVPGLAWLEFHVGVTEPDELGAVAATLRQRATFFPRGLAGHAYWYTVLPFHGIVFPSMLRRISAAAVARDRAQREAQEAPEAPGYGSVLTMENAARTR